MKIATLLIVYLLLTPLAVLEPRGQMLNQEETRVGAFYYEWYNGTGSLNCPNSGHWNETPKGWSVEDTPTIGYYNSCDPVSVNIQLNEMSAAGINFLIVSWWGMDPYDLAQQAWVDAAVKTLYNVANASFPNIKIVIMVEGFNESGTYDFNYTKSYIYTNFYRPYPNEMFFLPGSAKPLLCWWNAPLMTDADNRGPIHNDTIFDDRILGQNTYPNIDWYTWTPCSVNSSRTPFLNNKDGGVVTIEPRYDGSHIPTQGPNAVFDQNYIDELYDYQWNFVLNNHDKISLVLIYSWNEYHERTEIEPCNQTCTSDPNYLYNKTEQYIGKLRNLERARARAKSNWRAIQPYVLMAATALLTWLVSHIHW